MRILLAYGLFWTSVACCLVAQFFIIRSILGTHLPAAGGPPGVPAGAGEARPLPRRRGGLELLWAVVPAVGLAVLLYFTWQAVERYVGPSSLSSPAAPEHSA